MEEHREGPMVKPAESRGRKDMDSSGAAAVSVIIVIPDLSSSYMPGISHTFFFFHHALIKAVRDGYYCYSHFTAETEHYSGQFFCWYVEEAEGEPEGLSPPSAILSPCVIPTPMSKERLRGK